MWRDKQIDDNFLQYRYLHRNSNFVRVKKEKKKKTSQYSSILHKTHNIQCQILSFIPSHTSFTYYSSIASITWLPLSYLEQYSSYSRQILHKTPNILVILKPISSQLYSFMSLSTVTSQLLPIFDHHGSPGPQRLSILGVQDAKQGSTQVSRVVKQLPSEQHP